MKITILKNHRSVTNSRAAVWNIGFHFTFRSIRKTIRVLLENFDGVLQTFQGVSRTFDCLSQTFEGITRTFDANSLTFRGPRVISITWAHYVLENSPIKKSPHFKSDGFFILFTIY